MKPLTHGSLFAGIGGFDAGFSDAGMQVVWQVEIEPFPRSILRTKFPEAELFEDVRECGKHNLRAVDVLTAGFPCQDLSVAGKRAGLAGARSGLFWEVVRILGELRPAWFVLENVPGLFSSNEGRDFAVVLNSLDELGYGLAWRVLDSQFFGVAQRRRRVFIVGSFGKPCPAEVLFESESGEGDFAEGGEARKELAYEIAASLRGGDSNDPRGFRLDDETGLCAIEDRGETGRRGEPSDFREPSGDGSELGACGFKSRRSSSDIVSQAISSKWAKGSSGPAGDEHHNLVSVRLAQTSSNGWGISQDGRTHTLDGTGGDAVLTSLCELGSGGPDDNDGYYNRIISAPANSERMRCFTGLPEGLDSARYRALGNAVTKTVAAWIGKRIVTIHLAVEGP